MLEKFVGLPQLVSTEPEIVDLVLNPDNPNAVRTANWFLKGRMVLLGAADIYVIGPDGTTLAASNFEGPVSFVGENFSYRPYFQDAMAGFFGRFFALGTTSGKRGYYFSAAIRVGSVARGVIVFKIDLDSIEETWRSEEYEVIVTDPDGIVFMASRNEWLYTTLEPLTPQLIERTAQTRRYDDAIIAQLPLRRVGAHGDLDLIEIASAGSGREYISVSEEMPLAGWTVSVLMDTAPARSQTLVILTAAGLFLSFLALVGWVLLQRRARQKERMRQLAATRKELERRVADRTAALNDANIMLRNEVVERNAAEQELRRTQDDLVQAGKLAALGQMSAALSHEFNQPLTAIRNFSRNASTFIDRGESEFAKSNMERIGHLTERLANISRSLRNFARRPGETFGAVSVADSINAVLDILAWRLNDGSMTVSVSAETSVHQVRAEPVRLQQVLMNIIGNAADACADKPGSRLVIDARRQGNAIEISLSDNGPGIPAAIVPRIFDPFFTTKDIGSGMGLGLSISYNIVKDFGGDLKVDNSPLGGAEFIIVLPAHQASQSEATWPKAQ